MYNNCNFGGFNGPKPMEIDKTVLDTDLEKYAELKSTLLIHTALGGLCSTAKVGLVKGSDNALTYM